jgi:hypothetical protein
MCGGGSDVEADVVRDDRGWRDAGVEVRRSEYAMKDSRLWACVGEGGCESTGSNVGTAVPEGTRGSG